MWGRATKLEGGIRRNLSRRRRGSHSARRGRDSARMFERVTSVAQKPRATPSNALEPVPFEPRRAPLRRTIPARQSLAFFVESILPTCGARATPSATPPTPRVIKSTSPSIDPSTHRFIDPSIHRPIDPSIHRARQSHHNHSVNMINDAAITAIPMNVQLVTYLSCGSYLSAVGRSSFSEMYTIIPPTIPNSAPYALSLMPAL